MPEETVSKSPFHRWLDARLAEAGMTQVRLADELGVDKQVLHKWINGSNPSYETLRKLAELVGEAASDWLS